MMEESDLHILYLTKNCNLHCKYCYEGEEKCNEKMDPDTVRKSIDFIFENVPNDMRAKILLFGGEPLINWEGCLAAMDQAQRHVDNGRSCIMSVTTNGLLLKPDRVKAMYEHRKIFNIQVSIDGDEESHNQNRVFRNGLGSHKYVVKNVENMLKYFPFAQARMVIADVDKMFSNIKYLTDLGFRDICIQAMRFNDGRMQDEYYLYKFQKELILAEEYVKTLNLVRISEVQRPISRQSTEEMKEEADNSDARYKYFLPDGGKVFQKTYTEENFQHFTEGENASYNLLKK